MSFRIVLCVCCLAGCASQSVTERPKQVPPGRATAARNSTSGAKPAELAEQANVEGDTKRQIRELRKAQALYRAFLEHAGRDEHYREAVERSRERIEDIDATIEFLERDQ